MTTEAKAILSGGPAEGVVETQAMSRDGRVWTINVVHVNCACEWCAKVEGTAVEHVYERCDDDVFAYRESREPSDAAIPWAKKTAPNRVRPRECVANARDALNRAYGYDRAAIPLLIEAVDWLRRALEQMVPEDEHV